jgi:hypothetical protein
LAYSVSGNLLLHSCYCLDGHYSERPAGDNKKTVAFANGKHLDLFRLLGQGGEIVIFRSHQVIEGKQ